jgi:muramoyltetrapeptide carboxypeptidase LdcA involved in peptidoglycan recycling
MMNTLIKPARLNPGDKVAAVSLSSGLAGSIPYRYHIGKKQVHQAFGIELVEMENTLKDIGWISKNPEARANDLMEAFLNPEIKGIISTIGGEDSIRILPYVDLDVIRSNPKIFLGFSDTTVTHMICIKAGLGSFYGPSILAGFAENQGILPYTENSVRDSLFTGNPAGEIKPSPEWTNAYLDWFDPSNQEIKRPLFAPPSRKWLQGKERITGNLIGGCVQTLFTLNGTELWPNIDYWKESIIFLDISESELPLSLFRYLLRSMGAQGIWNVTHGIILGRPGGDRSIKEMDAYDQELQYIVGEEYGCKDLPILTRMDFGHTDPVMTIPYGVLAELNVVDNSFKIIESGVY